MGRSANISLLLIALFCTGGDVIYAHQRRPIDDSLASLFSSKRQRHPLHTAFATYDATTYAEIATVSVERQILDMALESSNSYMGLVCVDHIGRMTLAEAGPASSLRLYEVGRPKPGADDDDTDEEAADEEEEEDDEDDSGEGDALDAIFAEAEGAAAAGAAAAAAGGGDGDGAAAAADGDGGGSSDSDDDHDDDDDSDEGEDDDEGSVGDDDDDDDDGDDDDLGLLYQQVADQLAAGVDSEDLLDGLSDDDDDDDDEGTLDGEEDEEDEELDLGDFL
jgi:HIV-1 Vpr-binding protein